MANHELIHLADLRWGDEALFDGGRLTVAGLDHTADDIRNARATSLQISDPADSRVGFTVYSPAFSDGPSISTTSYGAVSPAELRTLAHMAGIAADIAEELARPAAEQTIAIRKVVAA